MRHSILGTLGLAVALVLGAAVGPGANGSVAAAAPGVRTEPAVAGERPGPPPGPSVMELAGFVADDVHQRVFLGDAEAGTVQAARYDGRLVDATSAVEGVTDLALAPDGSALYAASWATHEVVALDPATLEVVARYAVPTGFGPRSLAYAGGRVWFSYGDQWDGNLGAVDPATGAVAMDQYGDRIWGQALLDGVASRPDVLAVAETGLASDSLAVLDVAEERPVELAYQGRDDAVNDGIAEIDLVPGADQVLLNGSERLAWGDGTFRGAGAYPTGWTADISESGFVAGTTPDEVRVHAADGTVPVSTTAGSGVALAWAGDESRLFVLRGVDGPYHLDVIDDPAVATPTLRVDAPSSARRGSAITVAGSLHSARALPGRAVLQVRRTDLDHPHGRALPDVRVGPDGSWRLRDTPTAGGMVTYAVSWAGDATHHPARGWDRVAVSRTRPHLTLRPRAGEYAYGTRVAVSAHLGRTGPGRVVELWADPVGDAPRQLLRRGTVDRDGILRATVVLRRTTQLSAVYAGDSRTAPRTVTTTPRARVALRLGVAGHYRTRRVGGTVLRYLRRDISPVLTTTMTPGAGRRARVDVEVRDGRRWRPVTSGYHLLDDRGRVRVSLTAPARTGTTMRVRAGYVTGRSGDRLNATTLGDWAHLIWTE